MIEESWLVNLLKERTSYSNIVLADDVAIDLIHLSVDTPRIFVGTVGIKLQYPETFFADAYKELENQELQVFSVQFICKRSDLATVRNNIKIAYTGQSPFPLDSNYSSVAFMEASLVAKTSTKVWFQELLGVVMPRIS